MTAGFRVSLLWEHYGETLTKSRAEALAEEVKNILTDHIEIGKVITYVEQNPPADEVELT